MSSKRQLFFDRKKICYLEFDLEKTKTCKEIYETLNREIEIKKKEVYETIIKGIKFNFIIIYSKLNNKIDNSSLIEFKIDMNFQLADILQTNQYNLYYLPERNYDIKKNIYKERFNEFACHKEEQKNIINKNELEIFLNNEGIYYFDKANIQFIYGKGNLDEQKLIINIKKSNIEILIKEIKKDNYFENEIPFSLQVFNIKYPNYILEIRQNNTTHILGVYKQRSYLLWKNAINSAKIKNASRRIGTQFTNDLNKNNYLFFTNCHSIPSKCIIINQILENPEKRQIFFEEFNDKKISDIASNIYLYKIYLKNKEYIGALACVKQISFYIDYYNVEGDGEKDKEKEFQKYKNIFTKERIDYYKAILKKVNDIFADTVNNGANINNILKDIFKEDLFDNLYYQIYDLFIVPFFQKFKETLRKEYDFDRKPVVVKKFHLLLSKYSMNYFNMKDINNFNCLCSNYTQDIESNINNIRNNSNEIIGANSNENTGTNINEIKIDGTKNNNKNP